MEENTTVEEQQKPKNKSPFHSLIPRKDYFITPILLNLNILVFVLMVLNGVGIVSPDGKALIAWGANFRPYTLTGQPWRLFTSMFLHFGIIHLAVNMLSLYSLGDLLEKFIGRWRFLLLYLFTGLCGSVVSVWWHTDNSVSAGASGAIFGLFGIFAALVTTDLINPDARKQLLVGIGRTIVLNALIGLWSGVDNSAHLGGFLSGVAAGYLIYFDLKSWYRERVQKYVGLILAILLISGAVFFFWKNAKPPMVVAEEIDTGALMNRYDNERAAAFDFISTIDSATTLQEINTNIADRWKHCEKILDTIQSIGLTDEGEKYFDELRKSTLWGVEGSKYYQRSVLEKRPDFLDSGAVLMNKHTSTFEALNKKMQEENGLNK